MKSTDRRKRLNDEYSTNPERSLIRQKLSSYFNATSVNLNDVKNIKDVKGALSSSLSKAKYKTRIIKFAKLLKISPSPIYRIVKKEIGVGVNAQTFIDNRIFSSLIAQNKISSKHIQKSIISFENITFFDNYIRISSGKLKELIIKDDSSYSTLNVLHKYWIHTNQLFEIYYASNHILALSPSLDINKYIKELYIIASENVVMEDDSYIKGERMSSIAIQETIPQDICQRGIAFKSPYIDFLSLHQKDNVIYRCIERNNSVKEEGFIFTIPIDAERIALIFENVHFGRSTELFIAYKENSKSCLENIFKWFTSNQTNKRDALRSKKVEKTYFDAIEYYSIPHLDINQWILNINKIINIIPYKENDINFMPGFRNAMDITKEIQPSSSHNVRNIHNTIARKLYKTLNIQYPNQVGNEIQIVGQHRIDMVVKNTDGSYMFYEIKSQDDGLKCIREGVGQLMGYKFLVRDCCKVSKLVIVGTAEKTKEIDEYMAIYSNDDLPISYMQIAI